MKLKKLFGFVHLWMGLASGIVVFIIGITGCLYCFDNELKNYFNSDKIYVENSNQPRLALDSLKIVAQNALGAQYPISGIEYSTAENKSWLFKASLYNKEGNTFNQMYRYNKTVYINPYNAKIINIENTKWSFFQIVISLHLNLMMGNIGKQIVGWATVIFVLSLITGLILWWPKNKAALKRRIKFAWKDTSRWKRKNYDLHNVIGFYAMPLLLLIGLTGLVFAFKWFDDNVQLAFNGGTKHKHVMASSDTTKTTSQKTSLDKVITDATAKFPEANTFNLTMPKTKKATLNITVQSVDGRRYKRATINYDQSSGVPLMQMGYDNKNPGQKFRAMTIDLHDGSIAGFWGRVLAFLISLIAASLPVTGFYIWWGRKYKKKAQAKKTVLAVNTNQLNGKQQLSIN
ncbi:PepSY-associated TM helix domain-containing protein [Ferruginibacter sp.]|nr:PepSY domain-containing protein [Ferruginibacter sp.]